MEPWDHPRVMEGHPMPSGPCMVHSSFHCLGLCSIEKESISHFEMSKKILKLMRFCVSSSLTSKASFRIFAIRSIMRSFTTISTTKNYLRYIDYLRLEHPELDSHEISIEIIYHSHVEISNFN